jgi:hypothetical protein
MTTGTTTNRPWCVETGHAPNPKHDTQSVCALAWEMGITPEDNEDEYRELKRLVAADRRNGRHTF